MFLGQWPIYMAHLVKWLCEMAVQNHDDVIKWKHFPRYWPFVRGIHRSPVNSPHKGQWRGALICSLICVWINGWVNNREAGDLRRYRAHYDVSVMWWPNVKYIQLCCKCTRASNESQRLDYKIGCQDSSPSIGCRIAYPILLKGNIRIRTHANWCNASFGSGKAFWILTHGLFISALLFKKQS